VSTDPETVQEEGYFGGSGENLSSPWFSRVCFYLLYLVFYLPCGAKSLRD